MPASGRVHIRRELGHRTTGDAPGDALYLGVRACRVLVDPVDAGAGDDVVELLEQQQLPGPLHVCAVVSAGRQRSPELRVAQSKLTEAVAAFDRGLRRVCA